MSATKIEKIKNDDENEFVKMLRETDCAVCQGSFTKSRCNIRDKHGCIYGQPEKGGILEELDEDTKDTFTNKLTGLCLSCDQKVSSGYCKMSKLHGCPVKKKVEDFKCKHCGHRGWHTTSGFGGVKKYRCNYCLISFIPEESKQIKNGKCDLKDCNNHVGVGYYFSSHCYCSSPCRIKAIERSKENEQYVLELDDDRLIKCPNCGANHIEIDSTDGGAPGTTVLIYGCNWCDFGWDSQATNKEIKERIQNMKNIEMGVHPYADSFIHAISPWWTSSHNGLGTMISRGYDWANEYLAHPFLGKDKKEDLEKQTKINRKEIKKMAATRFGEIYSGDRYRMTLSDTVDPKPKKSVKSDIDKKLDYIEEMNGKKATDRREKLRLIKNKFEKLGKLVKKYGKEKLTIYRKEKDWWIFTSNQKYDLNRYGRVTYFWNDGWNESDISDDLYVSDGEELYNLFYAEFISIVDSKYSELKNETFIGAKFCAHCGSQEKIYGKFCTHCGKKNR